MEAINGVFWKSLPSALGRLPEGLLQRLLRYDLQRSFAKSRGEKTPVADFIEFLAELGVGTGGNVMLHSSWDALGGCGFRQTDLIDSLISLLGPQGTLAMPCFPLESEMRRGHFDVATSPTGAGLLAETFRRYPNVKRSGNIDHSVCAHGPNASFLVDEHHKSITSWDTLSPYFRIGQLEESWIVGFGVGTGLRTATSIHCADSILKDEVVYYRDLFVDQVSYSFTPQSGKTESANFLRRTGLLWGPKLAKHFTKDELVERSVGGVEVYGIRAATLIERTIALGRKGVSPYVWPPTIPHRFRPLSS
jgi:aminoglycoside 3-N-acetyltransferase